MYVDLWFTGQHLVLIKLCKQKQWLLRVLMTFLSSLLDKSVPKATQKSTKIWNIVVVLY